GRGLQSPGGQPSYPGNSCPSGRGLPEWTDSGVYALDPTLIRGDPEARRWTSRSAAETRLGVEVRQGRHEAISSQLKSRPLDAGRERRVRPSGVLWNTGTEGRRQ